MRPVVYTLLGPTGAGKTALLETLADLAPGRYEIISCDSRQIYRGLEIGSAAPVAELCARLPHHVVGHVSPAESYSAARFREEALAAIAETLARGRIPFLVGGSGFYFRALSTQLFESPGDEHSQAEIRARVSALSPAGRLARLRELDSDALAAPGEQPSAGRVHVNDDYRIGRALEICLSGGPLYSERWRASLARLQNATDSDSGGEGDYRFAGWRLELSRAAYWPTVPDWRRWATPMRCSAGAESSLRPRLASAWLLRIVSMANVSAPGCGGRRVWPLRLRKHCWISCKRQTASWPAWCEGFIY